jgi:glyoxylase-like metal-dependent hydrolase (beta-lactamase superfamily II)
MGQCAVYVPRERVVIVGDTIFSNCQTWLRCCDLEGWLKTLDFLKTLEVDTIIPGHGKAVGKEYIDVQKAVILEWMFTVADAVAKGWTRQECLQRISFADRCPVDVGQEDSLQMVQEININSLYNHFKGENEKIVVR